MYRTARVLAARSALLGSLCCLSPAAFADAELRIQGIEPAGRFAERDTLVAHAMTRRPAGDVGSIAGTGQATGPARPLVGAGQWLGRGMTDCLGSETPNFSHGSADPDPQRCTPQTEGLIAVCWDGSVFKNGGRREALCTYQEGLPRRCTDNASPGIMYECVRR